MNYISFMFVMLVSSGLNGVFGSEINMEEYYKIDEDGEVIDKYSVVSKAVNLLTNSNVDIQILGAKILTDVLPLPPSERMFFEKIDRLLSSEQEVIYMMGIEAIQKHMNNNKNYWVNDYYFLQKIPMCPGKITTKWLKLVRDIGNHDNLCVEGQKHIANNLDCFIKTNFKYMSDDAIKSELQISKIEINKMKILHIEEARELLQRFSGS